MNLLKDESKVMEVLHILEVCLLKIELSTEESSAVEGRQRHIALMTLALNTKRQPRRQLLLLTQTPLHAFNLCRAYFFFPPNDIFSVFFFCASLNKRHTFMLANGLVRACVCMCVCMHLCPRVNG